MVTTIHSADAELRCNFVSYLNGKRCELLLVDGSLIDGVSDGQVDHFTKQVKKINVQAETSLEIYFNIISHFHYLLVGFTELFIQSEQRQIT